MKGGRVRRPSCIQLYTMLGVLGPNCIQWDTELGMLGVATFGVRRASAVDGCECTGRPESLCSRPSRWHMVLVAARDWQVSGKPALSFLMATALSTSMDGRILFEHTVKPMHPGSATLVFWWRIWMRVKQADMEEIIGGRESQQHQQPKQQKQQ